MYGQLGVCNEGRIRPSFIAALFLSERPAGSVPTRVEFDPPSLRPVHLGAGQADEVPTRVEFDPPSLRQAGIAGAKTRPRQQRGSNSTLLHCGLADEPGGFFGDEPTRVEFDPPSLRPHLGAGQRRAGAATRVEFDPPSLRRSGERERGALPLQRGSNSTLLHCGISLIRGISKGSIQRGSNSTLLHCGAKADKDKADRLVNNEGRIRPSFIAAFARLSGVCVDCSNEGRIRPSFIAAAWLPPPPSSPWCNEGRIRPSFIAATWALPARCRRLRNEGRIRPSFIAAEKLPSYKTHKHTNEGRIRPSFIAATGPGSPPRRPLGNEGRIRPSFIAAHRRQRKRGRGRPTRVEFDPPSLRQTAFEVFSLPGYQRGSNSTLLHCGALDPRSASTYSSQRGSNSTLLHCGTIEGDLNYGDVSATRVEFDPPSLRHGSQRRAPRPGGATRVEFDPPSLRPTIRDE